MIRILALFLVLTAVTSVLSSCSPDAYAWKASGTDFNHYKTYAWLTPGDTVLNGQRKDKLFAGSIELSVNSELTKKGMTKVTRHPDAVFMFDTHSEGRTKYEQGPTLSLGVAYGGPGYYVGGSAPVAGGKITAIPYQEGLLIIEMFDTQTRQLIWRGWAQRHLNNSTDIQKEIKDAVKYMMYKLPVKIKG